MFIGYSTVCMQYETGMHETTPDTATPLATRRPPELRRYIQSARQTRTASVGGDARASGVRCPAYEAGSGRQLRRRPRRARDPLRPHRRRAGARGRRCRRPCSLRRRRRGRGPCGWRRGRRRGRRGRTLRAGGRRGRRPRRGGRWSFSACTTNAGGWDSSTSSSGNSPCRHNSRARDSAAVAGSLCGSAQTVAVRRARFSAVESESESAHQGVESEPVSRLRV